MSHHPLPDAATDEPLVDLDVLTAHPLAHAIVDRRIVVLNPIEPEFLSVPTDPGVTPWDHHVAAIGARARTAGNTAAVTDPQVVAAIRARIRASVEPGAFRKAWRHVLRHIRAANCGNCGAMLYTNGTCPNCDRR